MLTHCSTVVNNIFVPCKPKDVANGQYSWYRVWLKSKGYEITWDKEDHRYVMERV